MWVQRTDDNLTIEEEYIGRRWLIAIAVVFALVGFGPGAVAAVANGKVALLAVGGCLVVFVFYLPFLAVLALSSYRRVEIDTRDGSVESWVVPRLRRPTVRRFAAGNTRAVLCERVPNSEGSDGLRIALITDDGARTALITRAAWSDDVVGQLRAVLGDKLLVL
jgi:hypothetical protein